MPLQLLTCVHSTGELELRFADAELPSLGDDDLLVEIQATPINPSDLGLLLAMADLETLKLGEDAGRPVLKAQIPEKIVPRLAARFDEALPVGNEGAGVVVDAGSSAAAQALIGRTVALWGGGMYAERRVVDRRQCLPLLEGTSAREGASCFVNPLTALGMVETMRMEGHKALVHTAAASNLGQMLNRLCNADDVPLVNIVRRPEQVELLKRIGARIVCDSSQPDFEEQLVTALADTGATVAFDAIGGGELATTILTAMEAAINRTSAEYNRYGSFVHKQVYIYGGLDLSPTTIRRNFGMTWGVGGWLLTPFLQKVGSAAADRLRDRVAREVTTTFASNYTAEIPLLAMLQPDHVRRYAKQSTGEKFLIVPSDR